MKVVQAKFWVQHRNVTYFVNFEDDVVSVKNCDNEELLRLTRQGEYKPCGTHAMELVRYAIVKDPATEHAKQRKKKSKPKLRVTK